MLQQHSRESLSLQRGLAQVFLPGDATHACSCKRLAPANEQRL